MDNVLVELAALVAAYLFRVPVGLEDDNVR